MRTVVARVFGAIVVLAVFAGGGIVRSNVLGSAAVAIAGGIAVVTLLAMALYWYLLRSRSALGSGLAIRTESFRRFLHASEGQHVDWAWQHGVLREYSAWAVALGAADAWRKAIAASHVPPTAVYVGSNPLVVHSMMSSLASTHTAPSSLGIRRRRWLLRRQRRRRRRRGQLRLVVTAGAGGGPACRGWCAARPRPGAAHAAP